MARGRFYFFSNEGNSYEPIHLHAESGDGEARFWLDPEVTIAYSAGDNRKQLTRLRQIVIERRDEIERLWMRFSAKTLSFDEHTMWVGLNDGRSRGVPLPWFPRLLDATPA